MQDRTGLTVFLVRVVFVLFETRRFCKVARFVFPDLNYRNQLKDQNVLDVNNKEYNYQTGDHYMDIISECEKLGDYVVNVVEARTDIKEKKI